MDALPSRAEGFILCNRKCSGCVSAKLRLLAFINPTDAALAVPRAITSTEYKAVRLCRRMARSKSLMLLDEHSRRTLAEKFAQVGKTADGIAGTLY